MDVFFVTQPASRDAADRGGVARPQRLDPKGCLLVSRGMHKVPCASWGASIYIYIINIYIYIINIYIYI